MPWSSNATLLARVCLGPDEALVVYKPLAGERPLRDFPPGLHRREVAASVLSDGLGWDLVPPTVLRTDAPAGEGSIQLVIDADHAEHYFTIRDDERFDPWLRRLATFDLLTNQTDRKAGHILVQTDRSRLWAIDNGLGFHVETKVRTVLWDFAGDPIPAGTNEALTRLADAHLPAGLGDLLDDAELHRLTQRARLLLDEPVFPEPPWGDYSYPWPMV